MPGPHGNQKSTTLWGIFWRVQSSLQALLLAQAANTWNLAQFLPWQRAGSYPAELAGAILFRQSSWCRYRRRAPVPHTILLVAFVNTGYQYVVLKPWAWQTLLMFVHNLTSNQSGAGLDIAKAGCALSLLPSGVRPVSGQSPEGTVDG